MNTKILVSFLIIFFQPFAWSKTLLDQKLGSADSEIMFEMLDLMIESRVRLTPFSYRETRTFETTSKEFSIRCEANKLSEFGYQDHKCAVVYKFNPKIQRGIELIDGPLASAKIVQLDNIKEGSRLYTKVLKSEQKYRSTEQVPFKLLNGKYTSFPFMAIDCEEVSLMYPELAKCQVTIVPRV